MGFEEEEGSMCISHKQVRGFLHSYGFIRNRMSYFVLTKFSFSYFIGTQA